MANYNCLEGMRCPACKQETMLRIEIKTLMDVYDDGTDIAHANTEWDSDSYCQCPDCDYEGTVANFRYVDGEDSDDED